MPTGRVRWFDAAKGYGFITSEEGKDVFLPAQAYPLASPRCARGPRWSIPWWTAVVGRRPWMFA